jgi:hypothetical protein
MAANLLPIMMMSSMMSSCSSSVSTPAVLAFFFWSRVAAFFGAIAKGLNPFNAVKNVGKTVVGGVKKGAQAIDRGGRKAVKAIGRSAKKTGRAISRSTKKTGRALKKAFKIKKIRIKCFSPETPIKLQNGETVLMKNLKLGDILINGSVVDAVMKIRNENDPYYKLPGNIIVTGSHYIRYGGKYIHVKNVPEAKPTGKVDPVVYCLVTSDHKIPVGEYTFWDWEDNLVPTQENVDILINKIKVKRSMKNNLIAAQ